MTSSATLSPTALVSAIEAATLAPSMHNSQPWRFRVTTNEIELFIDPERQLSVADPDGRAARLACGAALFNLRLAVAMLGRSPQAVVLPDTRHPLLVARTVLGPPRPPTPEERELYAAIPRRHSNRYPFLDVPVLLEHRTRLRAAAQRESAWLDFLLGPVAITMVSELIRTADRALSKRPEYRAELAGWTRYDGEHCSDGVPEAAGGPAPQPHELLP